MFIRKKTIRDYKAVSAAPDREVSYLLGDIHEYPEDNT
jgi:hypothetical protein